MGTAYKADVVKLPSTAQIAKISQQLGYDLVNAEIQEYRGQSGFSFVNS